MSITTRSCFHFESALVSGTVDVSELLRRSFPSDFHSELSRAPSNNLTQEEKDSMHAIEAQKERARLRGEWAMRPMEKMPDELEAGPVSTEKERRQSHEMRRRQSFLARTGLAGVNNGSKSEDMAFKWSEEESAIDKFMKTGDGPIAKQRALFTSKILGNRMARSAGVGQVMGVGSGNGLSAHTLSSTMRQQRCAMLPRVTQQDRPPSRVGLPKTGGLGIGAISLGDRLAGGLQ
jgi:hypothetical protein